MGRRLFRNWIASPLCRPSAIYKRLDAVEDLCELFIEREDLRKKLAKIPDLEKLESTIHTLVRLNIEKLRICSNCVTIIVVIYRYSNSFELDSSFNCVFLEPQLEKQNPKQYH